LLLPVVGLAFFAATVLIAFLYMRIFSISRNFYAGFLYHIFLQAYDDYPE
jgi:hypothetical protein